MTEIPEYIQDIINSTPRLKKEELNKLLKQYRTVSYTHLTLPTTPYV